MLTIAIPTYDRNDKLVRSVELLLPQLVEGVTLLILDNCSKIPVADSLSHRLAPNVQVIRNKYNVGMAANIIRCFENCTTEWMWLLGDDDPPHENAVEIILRELEVHSDFSFFNFKSHLASGRMNDDYAIGPDEFISKIDDFGNLLFLSLGVYNLQKLQCDFRLAYQLAYCLAPHMVLLLSGIKSDTKIGFLAREPINVAMWDTGASWSWLSVSMSIPTLYEVPLALGVQAKRRFAQMVKTHIKPPKQVHEMLVGTRYDTMPTYDKRFFLRQIFFRSLLFRTASKYILSFLWYDLKLLLDDKSNSRKVDSVISRDERV
ncbi:MAG: glycosyltransferase family 2 protein [Sphingobacteriaceae bacterium]|nr:MAG: glycosyltransferase family 2 protein [Sphingobacteriaceae bacterium]